MANLLFLSIYYCPITLHIPDTGIGGGIGDGEFSILFINQVIMSTLFLHSRSKTDQKLRNLRWYTIQPQNQNELNQRIIQIVSIMSAGMLSQSTLLPSPSTSRSPKKERTQKTISNSEKTFFSLADDAAGEFST